jgi:hypothetical protein
MKAKKWAFIIMLLIVVSMLSTCKKEGDEVALIIDGEKISINQFNKYYYLFAKMQLNLDKKEADKMASNPEIENHPAYSLLNKSKFMEYFVSRKLLYIKATKDESINKDDLNIVMDLAKLQLVSNYYALQKLKDDIKVTDQDKNDFFIKNKERLKGVPMNDETNRMIEQQISMEKMEAKTNQLIIDILGEIKVNKDGIKKYLNKIEKADKSKEK